MATRDPIDSASGVIDLEPLLHPIDEDHPAGRDLADEDDYHWIREARRADVEVSLRNDEFDRRRQLFQRVGSKSADWQAVVRIGYEALTRKTKDLQIAAWMTEALGRLHGFDGLRDGFRLLFEIQERYWVDAYPRLEPDDPESRYGPYNFLDSEKVLPLLIGSIPLTGGRGVAAYSYHHYLEAMANDALVGKKPEGDREEARAALEGQGKLFPDQWDRAVAQTPRSFYEGRDAELRACLEAFDAWEQGTVRLFPKGPRGKSYAPGLSNIRHVLVDCHRLVTTILEAKPAPIVEEPTPVTAPAADAEDAPISAVESESADEAEAMSTDFNAGDGRVNDRGQPEETPVTPDRTAAPATAPGPIADRADAYRRLLDVVEFLRREDPDNPVPYMLVRVYRMGEVYAFANRPSEAPWPSPKSEIRQDLRRLAADEQWNALGEQAEQALGRREGSGWLDAHRHAIQALEFAGQATVARACRSLLRMYLGDFPDLPRTELDDGTSAADTKTRAWLRDEGLLGSEPKPPDPGSAQLAAPTSPIPPTDDREVDVCARASELASAGREDEAIRLLQRAMTTSAGGRERFLIQLHLAELCVSLEAPQVALPLLEDLERSIDAFHLEQWEDPTLCARVVGGLFRCLRTQGTTEQVQHAYARLCRLDPHQAMREGPAPARR